MRLVLNVILLPIAAVLAYLLYASIQEPIAFSNERKAREEAVKSRLIEIRKCQELFRDITGEFAHNFDTLRDVLTTGKFALIAVIGDPDDPNFTGKITYDTTYLPAIDSIKNLKLSASLDSLRYVPYGGGATFDIQSDVIDYQSTEVPVVEVGARRKVFMGYYADKRFARYDKKYDPEKPIKFGNMGTPNLSGNWE